MVDSEQEMYLLLKHWQAERHLLSPEQLLSPTTLQYPLFLKAYSLTEKRCQCCPMRKNGEPTLIHSLNVVFNLQKAGVTEIATLTIGLVHDVVEDYIDSYRKENNIPLDENGPIILDNLEKEYYLKLIAELSGFSSVPEAERILKVVSLLTRNKREYYYQSIAKIFNSPDKDMKEKAIQVKLADRLHNILCIEHFKEEQRLYECFKNLFILNNTKKYIIETKGKNALQALNNDATVKLFKKCSKATYDAFLMICHLSSIKGIRDIRSMLQLAFRKFIWEKAGLWEVTTLDPSEKHPLRLFQGVIRKYDSRLVGNKIIFEKVSLEELSYCRNFFQEFHFSEEQLQAVLDYKDAYALKEMVAKLLYDRDYLLHGFLLTEMLEKSKMEQ